jgi:hypothetical protein
MTHPDRHDTRVPTWTEIRRLADELQVKMNLAGKELRDRWHAFQPLLARLEHKVSAAGDRGTKVLAKELSDIGESLKRMIDDLHVGSGD